jgi:hypothetical protein
VNIDQHRKRKTHIHKQKHKNKNKTKQKNKKQKNRKKKTKQNKTNEQTNKRKHDLIVFRSHPRHQFPYVGKCKYNIDLFNAIHANIWDNLFIYLFIFDMSIKGNGEGRFE